MIPAYWFVVIIPSILQQNPTLRREDFNTAEMNILRENVRAQVKRSRDNPLARKLNSAIILTNEVWDEVLFMSPRKTRWMRII